jgi:uncharacterized protein (TIGR03067 family)
MSVLLACPKCKRTLAVSEENLGKALQCPGCGTAFRTQAPAAVTPSAPPPAPPAKVPAPKPPPVKAAPAPPRASNFAPAVAETDRDSTPPPRNPPRKPAVKVPPPAPVKPKVKRPAPRDEEEEDDDMPPTGNQRLGTAAKKKGGCGTVLATLSAVGLVLLLGCAGAGYWFWTGLRDAAGQLASEAQARAGTQPEKPPPAAPTDKGGARVAPVDPISTGPGKDPQRDTAPAKPVVEPSQNDQAALERSWKTWLIEDSNGLTAVDAGGLVIQDKGIQFLVGGGRVSGELSIDPGKEPKEIEVKFTSGSGIGKTQLGIYRLSKGQLQISWGGVGDGRRPTKFTGKLTPGAGQSYVTYRSDEFKEDEAVVKELKALEGRWMAAPKADGVIIDGYKMQLLWGGNNKGAEARMGVDPDQDPKEIEIIYTAGSERYKRRVGIYKLDGDTLTLSLSNFDDDNRPTKFAASPTPGGGIMYAVYHREKDK